MATVSRMIGNVRLTVVEEFVLPTSVRWMFPDAEAPFDILNPALPWLQPHYANERGHLLQSMQTFIIEAGPVTIAVDTGVGNDKHRGGAIPDFNMRSGPFLEDLAAAGFPPERIDFVIATHMHTDHVGWNTRLEDGRWVPTFPNARYLFVDREWAHWSAEAANNEATSTLFEDSLQPVVDAGRVDIVTPEHRVADGVYLEPSFGHSPGHVNVRIASNGREAALIGDMMHNPIQAFAPTERPTFDRDPLPARQTRLEFLERTAGTEVLVYGSHWHLPVGGLIRREGDTFAVTAVEA